MQQYNPRFQQPRRDYGERRPDNGEQTNWTIPIAIVMAGIIVAGSLIYIKFKNPGDANVLSAKPTTQLEDNMTPISQADHILGNPNAPVVIVEYSDTECPFCQKYHKTLQQIIDEYAKTGQVAWVYRHFAFHPKSPKESEATECAAELGGNKKFWDYLDALYSKKNFDKVPYVGLEVAELPTIAKNIGLNVDDFNQCLASGRYKQKIANEYDNAVAAGAQGTPHTILVTKNGKIPIYKGAVDYAALKNAIATLLNQTPQQ
jgi:protein-disulfide isomerase